MLKKQKKLFYGDAAATMKMVCKWFEQFRNGCESVEDEERSEVFQHQNPKRRIIIVIIIIVIIIYYN